MPIRLYIHFGKIMINNVPAYLTPAQAITLAIELQDLSLKVTTCGVRTSSPRLVFAQGIARDETDEDRG